MNSLKYKLLHTARQLKYKRISSGVPPLTLQNAIAGKLLNYQIYGNSKQGELPEGYTQLEYIESNGEQYIDIGEINLDTYNTKLEYTGQWLSGSNNQIIFSYGEIVTKTNFKAWEYSGGYYVSTLGKETNIISTTVSTKHKVVMERTSSTSATFTVDGDLLVTTSGTFVSSSMNAYLLGVPDFIQRCYIGKLWYLKLWQNDVLIRNLIPCKNSNGTIGMYDLVNNVFYENAGTGDFVAGPEMPNPNNPIQIVGDKTKNLANKKEVKLNQFVASRGVGDEAVFNPKNGCVSFLVKCKPNTTYTISSKTLLRRRISEINNINERIITYDTITLSGGIVPYSFTTDATTNGLMICLQKGENPSEVLTQEFIDSEDIQLEEGATATDYEPYGYRVPINIRGKNLLDFGTLRNTGTTSTTLEHNSNYLIAQMKASASNVNPGSSNWSSGWVNLYIPKSILKKGNIYSISYNVEYLEKPDNVSFPIQHRDALNNAFISVEELNKVYRQTYSFISNGDQHEMGITCNSCKIKISDFQIEEGSTATEYEVYIEPVTTNIYLDEPLLEKDDSADYTDYGNRKLVRNISNVVLDGTEGWMIQWNDGNFPVFSVAGKIRDSKYFAAATTNILCANEYYRAVAFDKGSQSIWALRRVDEAPYLISINDTPSNPGKIYLKHLGITTVADLKAWLAEHNTVLYYVLNEPIEESIELPDILLNKGTNIIDVETSLKPSNIEVEYLSKSKI